MKRSFYAWLLGVLLILWTLIPIHAQTNGAAAKSDTAVQKRASDAAESKWPEWLIGGFLATAGGVIVALFTDWLQRQQKRREDEQFRQNVLRSIRCELAALSSVYDKGIGNHLKALPEGQPFLVKLYLTQDWFSVFDGNAQHFGKLDGEISEKIIVIYCRMKQMIEEFRINNECLDATLKAQLDANGPNPTPTVQRTLQFLQGALVTEAKKLKEFDQQLKTEFEQLLAALKERIGF
jgi:predicted outer membrane lipoprotein